GADGDEHANVTSTAERSDMLAEMEALRRRLSALEASIAGPAAGHPVACKRSSRLTARTLAILTSGAVLAGVSIVCGPSAVDALFVNKDGNVGIGTAEPLAHLDVSRSQATVYIRDTNSGVKITASGGGNYIESAGAGMSGSAPLNFGDM